MTHLSEEQLILHYYGEEDDALTAERHLGECETCRETYGALQRVLNVVDALPVPEPAENYDAEVWRRIQGHLPLRRRFSLRFSPWRWSAAAAFAGLLLAAFLAGRFYPQPRKPVTVAADPQVRERVLLVAVGDYLERSQMVLIELANSDAKGGLDISAEQDRAEDLVSEARLYRQTAAHTGDASVVNVLDQLERVLLDITHAPSQMSPQDLEKLRQRLASEGILFKIRVLGSNVRNREQPAAPDARQKL